MAAAGAPPPGRKLSYNPEPFEQAYYTGLFTTADVDRTGQIGGAQAVQFFQRSKLPIDALKNIWIVADQPPTNFLDAHKFAVAVRLIQCIQNGQKGTGTNLLSPPGVTMRPAMFDGVSGVSVPLPGGGPPPPPVGQQPPPQQQQQPPQQQQQQPQQPMNGGMSRALAVQDPYTLSATDQARFEEMFPTYARDGYVHGGEAVALFSKSGMPQAQLAAIWNMVDSPVDNRLDKLEFAMAMHLIVCISKRNLPMPPSLPASLQQLKTASQQQQQQQQQHPPPQGQPQQMGQQPPPQQQQPPPSPQQQPRIERSPTYDSSYGGGGGASAPMMQGGMPQQQPQQQKQPGMMMQGQPQMPPQAAGFGVLGGPPPHMQMQPQAAGFGMQGGPPPHMQMQQQQPGMYGGGSVGGGGSSVQGSPKPLGMQPLSFSMQQNALQQPQIHTAPSSPGGIPSPRAAQGGFGMPVQYGGFSQQQQREMPAPPLHQYQGRAVSPAMSAQTEPGQPTMMQQQQQPHHQQQQSVGGMPSGKEINVSSISDAFEGLDTGAVDEQSYVSAPPLYERNQQQQQQHGHHQYGGIPEPESVASTPEKTSFQVGAVSPSGGASHESFKSSHRGPFEDTQKLKSTLQKLQAENISLKAQLGSMTEGEQEAQEELSKTVAEIGVLSNQLTTLRAQVLAAKSRLLEATAELKAGREKKSVMTDLIAEAEATRIAIDEATASVESTIAVANKRAASPPPVQEDLFSFGPTPGQPILSQTPVRSNQHDQHIPTPDPVDPADQSVELPAPVQFAPEVETPSRNAYGNNFGQPSRPAAIQNLDRGFSTGSNFGFGPDAIMGAGSLPTPGPSFAFSAAESHDRVPGSESFDDVIHSVPSVGEIDAMKMKAKEAEDIARDAEESSRQALAQVNELRRLADEAEKEARKHTAEEDGKKKKKSWGRGGAKKKADAKEAERLAQDANAKKQQFLQAQSQANDAQALAKATKREAEKLRSEAEEAEIQAASAASMHQQQQDQEKQQHEQQQQQQHYSVPSNGYEHSGDFGAPGFSYSQQPFGGESGAFDPNVMGNRGGIDIPAPSGDPYDNPFGS